MITYDLLQFPLHKSPSSTAMRAHLSGPSPPKDIKLKVPRNKCIIEHGLPETRAERNAQETRNDIEKFSAIVKVMVPPDGQTVILKSQRLGPRGTNPPSSPRTLRVVVPDQTTRDLLMKACFGLRNLYS